MKKVTVGILSILGYSGVRHILKRELAVAALKRYNKVNMDLNAPARASVKALRSMLNDVRNNKESHAKRMKAAGVMVNPVKLLDYFEWEYRSHLNLQLKKQD